MALAKFLRVAVLCLFMQLQPTLSWDNEELELFDLVEELNANFYDVLGVSDSASSAEIRRAYRRLSLTLHPDKNKEENAETKFRQLVAVYEVLKDEQRRARYDQVLVNGLPDWRQPVFYYRRVRKLGLLELTLLLMLILTVGHFVVIWSIYLERCFEKEEVFRSLHKKRDKKGRRGRQGISEEEQEDKLQAELRGIPRPRLVDLIPIRMVFGTVHLVMSIPDWWVGVKEEWERKKREEIERQEEEQRMMEEERREAEEAAKRPKRRQRVEMPEYTDDPRDDERPVVYMDMQKPAQDEDVQARQVNTLGDTGWTDEDLAVLAKAVAKYPGGTPNRWEKIADMVGRPVSEVTKKSKCIKLGYAISVDPSAQGLTGSMEETLHFKKGQASIANDIISMRSDWPDSDIDARDPTGKKRHRPTNVVKSPDRTLMISQQQPQTEELAKDSAAGERGSEHRASKKNTPLKVDNSKLCDESMVWNQNQQKIFEWGLAQYPKGIEDRWGKIADHIPGKSKEECMQRFKYLAEIVRKRKQQQQQQETSQKMPDPRDVAS